MQKCDLSGSFVQPNFLEDLFVYILQDFYLKWYFILYYCLQHFNVNGHFIFNTV